MRFIVYGAGAIGGVIGWSLQDAGHEVVLVARGPHLAAMQADGLRLAWPDGSGTLPVTAVGDPADIDWRDSDVVIVAVKSQQTAAVLDRLAATAPETTPIVCAQNGVANEPATLRVFPNVYGMLVMCPAGHLRPGEVIAYSSPTLAGFDIGRYPSGTDATSAAIVAALNDAPFDARDEPDIMRWKRRKLIMNLGNAVDAASGMQARFGDLTRRAEAEGEAALAAAGLDVATVEEDAARRDGLLHMHRVDGERHPGSSSWQSLARGTGDIEADFLNGEVVLLGRLHEVPTPVNAGLQRVARDLAAGRREPGTMTEDELAAAVEADPT